MLKTNKKLKIRTNKTIKLVYKFLNLFLIFMNFLIIYLIIVRLIIESQINGTINFTIGPVFKILNSLKLMKLLFNMLSPLLKKIDTLIK